jgi:GT2 family glycosyltransferase
MGSKLGYPTANLALADREKLIPKEGIYAIKAVVETVELEGMMYIGKRPTVSLQSEVSIEVHLFDFNQNIYDKDIQVFIWKHIRDDIKFETIEGLINQLKIDDKTARTALSKSQEFVKTKAVITLAILNYNGVELLESYLPMLQYSSEKYPFDILVIDNGSTDLSVDFIREWYPEISVLELSKNYGFAGGYNKGLAEIETPYIALLNSDVLVTENWLDPIMEHLNTFPETGAVQPEILSIENKQKYEYAGASGGYLDILGYPFCRGRLFDSIEAVEGQYHHAAEIFWASGAAMVIRKNVFSDLGGFDSGFFAHQEEIDLSWRLHRAGYNIFCLPESRVYHLGGGTLDYVNPRKDFLNFRNNLYMLAKNESFARLAWLIPLRLILDGIAGFKFLLDGKPKSTIAIIKAHMSFYVHLPLVIERRNFENELISKKRIHEENRSGRYNGSILWKYYMEGVRKFSALKF